MIDELNEIKEKIAAFEKKYYDCGDYPEDDMIQLSESIDSALHHVKHFDWEQHAIDVRDGAIEMAADQRADR